MELLKRTKRAKRRKIIARWLKAADAYDDMATYSPGCIKDVPWKQYCLLMASLRRMDAAELEKVI